LAAASLSGLARFVLAATWPAPAVIVKPKFTRTAFAHARLHDFAETTVKLPAFSMSGHALRQQAPRWGSKPEPPKIPPPVQSINRQAA
jgi:hypothetical protein